MSNEAQRLNVYELVRYYYRQWATFIDLLTDQERAYSVIWGEVNRDLNLETNRALGIDEPFEQDHEDFLRGAVRKKIIPITRLWDIAKQKT